MRVVGNTMGTSASYYTWVSWKVDFWCVSSWARGLEMSRTSLSRVFKFGVEVMWPREVLCSGDLWYCFLSSSYQRKPEWDFLHGQGYQKPGPQCWLFNTGLPDKLSFYLKIEWPNLSTRHKFEMPQNITFIGVFAFLRLMWSDQFQESLVVCVDFVTQVKKCGDGVLGSEMMFFGLPKPYTLDLRQFFMFLENRILAEFWPKTRVLPWKNGQKLKKIDFRKTQI